MTPSPRRVGGWSWPKSKPVFTPERRAKLREEIAAAGYMIARRCAMRGLGTWPTVPKPPGSGALQSPTRRHHLAMSHWTRRDHVPPGAWVAIESPDGKVHVFGRPSSGQSWDVFKVEVERKLKQT